MTELIDELKVLPTTELHKDKMEQIDDFYLSDKPNGFTAPGSKMFSGYSDGTNTYLPDSSVTFNANTTLTASIRRLISAAPIRSLTAS